MLIDRNGWQAKLQLRAVGAIKMVMLIIILNY